MTVRHLGPSDVASLQDLLEATPAYHERVEGAPAGPKAGEQCWESLPPGCSPEEKLALGLVEEGRLLAYVEVARGYPAFGAAFLGLLLVHEARQGSGLGRRLYEAAEAEIRRLWPEVRRLRLAVADTNDVTAFWSRMGFADTGERLPLPAHTVARTAIMMEKPLAEQAPPRPGAA